MSDSAPGSDKVRVLVRRDGNTTPDTRGGDRKPYTGNKPDEKKPIKMTPALEALNREIESGRIKFPFRRRFFPPLSELVTLLLETPAKIYNNPYLVQSFYPPDSLYLDFPPADASGGSTAGGGGNGGGKRRRDQLLFQGSPTLIVATNDYRIDQITDLYIEDIRLAASRPGSIPILEYWTKPEHRKRYLFDHLERYPEDPTNIGLLRESLYHVDFETKQFRPTWIFGLLDMIFENTDLSGKTVLDISAGWGDRLLATMLCGGIYVGADPNLALQPRYMQMIKELTPLCPPEASGRVIGKPFEKIPATDLPDADIILTSPPFFDLEIYPGNDQSIQSFPERKDWFQKFLFPSIATAWSKLRVDGYLILHLGDSSYLSDTNTMGKKIPGSGRYNLATPTLLYLESFPDASWEGAIGVTGEEGRGRPVWIWKKVAPGAPVDRWNPRVTRSLKKYYPDLAS